VSAARQDAEAQHSGRLLLRMPRALHGDLAQAAEREGVSLNRLIVTRLSRSLAEPPARQADPRPERRSILRYALAANLVVLVLTAAVAVTLLVTAYR